MHSHQRWRLFVASFLSLYIELLFIRWIPSAIHVVGFFTNLVLIASFMGLGLGVARAGSKPVGFHALGRVLALCAFVSIFLVLKVQAVVPRTEHYVNESSSTAISLQLSLLVILPLVYAAVVWVFVPLGELVGYYLAGLPPLEGYAMNILGSIAGVVVFTVLSYLGISPPLWILLGGLTLLILLPRRALGAALVLLTVGLVAGLYRVEEGQHGWANLWTPYYDLKVTVLPPDSNGNGGGFAALVGNFFLLSGTPLDRDPSTDVYELYSLPYHFVQPKRLLVLGSGGGNDIGMALSKGVEHIDAVEIDPVVIQLGSHLNPEHPYLDSRVHVHNEDARTFLKNATGPYDLIIFGTLDSHGLFSALSSIKMENFVYTQQSFRDAQRLLSDHGVLACTVGYEQMFVTLRLQSMLTTLFGTPPLMYHGYSSMVTNLIGPGMKGQKAVELPHIKPLPPHVITDLQKRFPEVWTPADDDWPHLFLRYRKLPGEYLIIGLILVALSAVPLMRTFQQGGNFSPHFFFLGAGFLLLETKSITGLALTFGSTWITNSVVITAILLVILLANWWLLRTRSAPSPTVWYGLLLASLLATWAVPPESLVVSGFTNQALVAFIFVGLPVFFAATIFSTSFSRASNVNVAFGSNMLGAVVGGLSEYVSMATGFRFLCLLAAAMYVLSWIYLRGNEELTIERAESSES